MRMIKQLSDENRQRVARIFAEQVVPKVPPRDHKKFKDDLIFGFSELLLKCEQRSISTSSIEVKTFLEEYSPGAVFSRSIEVSAKADGFIAFSKGMLLADMSSVLSSDYEERRLAQLYASSPDERKYYRAQLEVFKELNGGSSNGRS